MQGKLSCLSQAGFKPGSFQIKVIYETINCPTGVILLHLVDLCCILIDWFSSKPSFGYLEQTTSIYNAI
jgi:hypothetical protein